ncbi:VOC family protein [Gorillibacterium massiliense]|uniref:VOC family protein n=1 Tax=Gorillibacterium massiliense TaxID=1280390 RepID=UPI0005943921|nr:VOC family protein [Gorillibacterium massiliense]
MSRELPVLFILFVRDQRKSKEFYAKLLDREPSLDVPGMTEFQISTRTKVGLMPGDGITRVLDYTLPNPNENAEYPRCELYLYVDEPDREYEKALAAGATGVSPGKIRNWGDYVAYCRDFDGNLIAFASTPNP